MGDEGLAKPDLAVDQALALQLATPSGDGRDVLCNAAGAAGRARLPFRVRA